MVSLTGLDWPTYFRGLSDAELYRLAVWLAAEGLTLGEFTETAERAFGLAPVPRHNWHWTFVMQTGGPAAGAYARRKRRFSGLSAALEDALLCGAMPRDVRPDELRICECSAPSRGAEDLFRTLQRAARGQG